jgi:outer membrane receptor protein involved in Fe transport
MTRLSCLCPVRARQLPGALLCLLAWGVPVPALRAQGATGVVSGRVTSAATQEPLAGVTVAVRLPAGVPPRSAVSDAEGRFLLRDVPVGVVRLEVRRLGYVPRVITDVVVNPAKPAEVRVELEVVAARLEAVAVRPSAFPTLPPARTPVSTQTFGAEEVRRAPGVQEDVVRAVSVLPGVGVTSAGRNDLVVRGGAPFENLFVVDGIEVPNINHFGTQGSSGGPLSLINIDFVDQASLSAGGFGVALGDRTASVTSIRLREGNRERVASELNLSATGGGAIVEGPLGKHATFLVGARRSYLDLLFKAAGFGFIPAYVDLTAKVAWRPTPRDRVSALLIGADGTVTFNNTTADNRYGNSRVAAPSQRQYFSGITWQHVRPRAVVTTTLGRTFTRYRTVQNDSGGAGVAPATIFRANTSEGEQSLRVDAEWRPGARTEVEAGGVTRFASTLDYDLLLPGTFRRDGAFRPVPLTVDTTFTASRSALYAQGTRQLGEAVRLTMGVRGDWYPFLRDAVRLSPRLAASWQPVPGRTLSLSVGRYWQPPSYIWLVGDPGNRTRLAPFAADQVVAGITQLLREDLKVQVEAYGKRYRAYPQRAWRPQAVLQPAGFDDITTDIPFGLEPLGSAGTGTAMGVELLVQKKLSEVPLYGLLTVSLNRTRLAGTDGTLRPGAFDAPVTANALLGWRPNARWELSGRVRGASGLPVTPFVTTGAQAGTLDFTRYNAGGRLPAFFALDVRADRRWTLGGTQLITYIDVQNATGRQNVSRIEWNYRTRVAEPNASLGVLPSIGITWEF